MIIDENQAHAVRLWVEYGFSPGSCTTCIINDDFDGALLRAHPILKNGYKYTFRELYDNVRSMIPPSLLNIPVNEWTGLHNCTSGMRELIMFEAELSEHTKWINALQEKDKLI